MPRSRDTRHGRNTRIALAHDEMPPDVPFKQDRAGWRISQAQRFAASLFSVARWELMRSVTIQRRALYFRWRL